MALEKQILERLNAMTVKLNEIQQNAKRTEEFPELTELELTSKIRVSYDTNSYWISMQRLFNALGLGGLSVKQPTQTAEDGQLIINTDPTFSSIDLHINNVWQIQGVDYTYASGTITMDYPLQEGDIITIRGYRESSSPSDSVPPVPKVYANLTELTSDQSNQITNFIYEVTDGSGFSGIDSGILWVKYLGTTNGDETDYSWQPRNGNLLEEDILGTCTENLTTTGASDLDVSVFSSHFALLTGNTVHTLTGLPASGKSIVKTWIVRSTATETYSIANADKVVGEYLADGTDTRVTAEISMFPTIGQYIVITYENLG